MSFFRRFASRWAAYKTFSEHKEQCGAFAIGDLLSEQMAHRQAPNYMQMSFSNGDGQAFTVLITKQDGKTPHELRLQAETKLLRCNAITYRLKRFTDRLDRDALTQEQRDEMDYCQLLYKTMMEDIKPNSEGDDQ